MHCSHCGQDAPPVASLDGEKGLSCARCGGELSPWPTKQQGSTAPKLLNLAETLAAIPLAWDDWEFDDELALTAPASPEMETRSANSDRGAAPGPSARDVTLAETRRPVRRQPARRRSAIAQAIAWAALFFSLMAFVCGGVLVGWSIFAERAELWRLGMPLALAGQAGWLIGLTLQVEGLWHSQRRVWRTLEEVEERLNELQHTAALLTASRSGAAQSFYAHLAEGASPNLLLADLKGQLDLLAMQLERRRAA